MIVAFLLTIYVLYSCKYLARASSSEGTASSAVGGAEATVQTKDPELAEICRGTPRTKTKKRGAREEKEGSLRGHLQRGGGGQREPALE